MNELLLEFENALPEVQQEDGSGGQGQGRRGQKRKRTERFPMPEEEQRQLLDRAIEGNVEAALDEDELDAQVRAAHQEQAETRPKRRRLNSSTQSDRDRDRDRDHEEDGPAQMEETDIRPSSCIVCSWERKQLPLDFMKKADILFVTLRQNVLVRDAEKAAVPNFLDGLQALFDWYARQGRLTGCLLWYSQNIGRQSVLRHFHQCNTSVVLRNKILADQVFNKIVTIMPHVLCYEMAPGPDGTPAIRPALDPVQVGCLLKMHSLWSKLLTFRVHDSPYFQTDSYIPNEMLRVKGRATIHAHKLKMGDTTALPVEEQRAEVVYAAENSVVNKLERVLQRATAQQAGADDPGSDALSTAPSVDAAFGMDQDLGIEQDELENLE
jgi:hypothetical protein